MSAVDRYCWLQSQLQNRNVALDLDFQRRFTGYYRVRRNADWRRHFYALLEREKLGTPSLTSALRAIHGNTGRVEGSFASKLVATVTPSVPVLDSVVLRNLKLTLPMSGQPDVRMNGIVRVHEQVGQAFGAFLQSDKGRELIARFRATFRTTDITETKMLDLVLWQTR